MCCCVVCNEKASNFLKELCADIDFSKAGYRPPLKEPLILARFDDEIINKLKDLGYKLESNELKASTQKQLFHGMRQEKLKTNRAFSKAQFIKMPKYLMTENLYIEKDCAGIRFYWQKDKVLVNYVYLTLKNGEFGLGTYGVTQKSFVDGQLKSQIIEKFVNGDGS
ncbi:MAG: hypothetical protein MR658_02470 [Campylobacter sp.]|uniref:hypothetical protein n=1 Tax=Campylobacter sp. TaxID=205 RepID=UPI002A503236|nr:hypothetical protein [Campylobacter sp.]MCI6177687.1 hypothetical protein [Campylobacter sp.]MCI7501361.1 hypothetical protein [Campylobacter sp.]MDD7091037.1 hypothetical protein [Campylobacteraceae bacterium]MDY5284633.1 hypothetical protein [Campylobacter sp.]